MKNFLFSFQKPRKFHILCIYCNSLLCFASRNIITARLRLHFYCIIYTNTIIILLIMNVINDMLYFFYDSIFAFIVLKLTLRINALSFCVAVRWALMMLSPLHLNQRRQTRSYLHKWVLIHPIYHKYFRSICLINFTQFSLILLSLLLTIWHRFSNFEQRKFNFFCE